MLGLHETIFQLQIQIFSKHIKSTFQIEKDNHLFFPSKSSMVISTLPCLPFHNSYLPQRRHRSCSSMQGATVILLCQQFEQKDSQNRTLFVEFW